MSNPNVEETLQEIAKKAIAAQDGNFWAKIAGYAILAFGIWYYRKQLHEKEKQLAAARAELELQKLKAQADLVDAKIKQNTDAAQKAMEDAERRLRSYAVLLEEHKAKEAELERLKYDLELVNNWEDLNRIAGVTP